MASPLDVARSQLGTIETGGAGNDSGNVVPYWDWWDGITGQHDQGQSWCGAFVSWCFDRAGMRLTIGNLPGYIYCPSGEAWFRSQGRLNDVTHAKAGDVAFFHFPNEPNEANHTGIIESVDAVHRTVTSVEGNTTAGTSGVQSNGGGVYRRTRSWSLVRSVGQPPYTEDDMFTDQDRALLQAVKAWIDKMENGAPLVGVEPLPTSTSFAHRNTKKIAAKLGITDAE